MSNQMNSHSNNLQWIQHRLNVKEQEINALKVQNRHLLEKLEELEKAAEPNQIDTQYVADEVKRHIDPVVHQLQSTLNASFEMIQSTLKGIYQQSQRAQGAVEQMAAHAQGLEIRMNEQRKQDQNFYQDKVFSMIGNFCDRLERQIDVRLKSLSVVEMMNARQNEVLVDLETMKTSIQSIQKFNEANRNDILRIERTSKLIQQTLIDQSHSARKGARGAEIAPGPRMRIQLQPSQGKAIQETQSSDPIEIEQVAENTAPMPEVVQAAEGQPETNLDGQIGSLKVSSLAKEDASVILSLLRAEKNELKRAARRAKEYLQGSMNPDPGTEPAAPQAQNPENPAGADL